MGHGSMGHGSLVQWVTWVMGHKKWPIVSSETNSGKQLSGLKRSHLTTLSWCSDPLWVRRNWCTPSGLHRVLITQFSPVLMRFSETDSVESPMSTFLIPMDPGFSPYWRWGLGIRNVSTLAPSAFLASAAGAECTLKSYTSRRIPSKLSARAMAYRYIWKPQPLRAPWVFSLIKKPWYFQG